MPDTDPQLEQAALHMVAAGAARGLPLRLLGGLAVRLRAPSARRPPFARVCRDIDLAAPARASGAVEAVLGGLGYLPDREFNVLNGATRLLFAAPDRPYHVDIFVGDFAMCHRVPLAGRLAHEAQTLPLAELLLTKLQIVELNAKDVQDIGALLLDHAIGPGDGENVSAERIAELCGRDWGLWKTVSLNLDTLAAANAVLALDQITAVRVQAQVAALRRVLADVPKTLAWKARATVGERRRWYTVPEEVERGGAADPS